MTFNIHHGKGTDLKVDLKRISEVISWSKADVIGLNEVDKHFSKRSHFVDQVQFLAKELNYNHAFSPSLVKSDQHKNVVQQYGNGLLSRFPFITNKHHLFNFFPRIIEGRSLLEASIELNDKQVYFYVTHLSLNPTLHKKQSDYILRHVTRPAIILGDWNMKPHSTNYKRITEKYTDVWEEKGESLGFTYPSKRPRVRLDYIFVSKGINVVDAKVLDTLPTASDHLPLVTTLSI
ncbi:endonuclease [Bacillus mesophilus]|uniref:Endonuclease n=2 Tax=Bacillus mesophilus TaxID=1808955 RepID=A0A6M0Q882_9BACI|nr:endonuclease/exonuclease/phosphatase family protein [Bacillus mesophilus]NEY72575.1 endonuclease [Bacillus mesophilus]